MPKEIVLTLLKTCEGAVSSVRIISGEIDEFPIELNMIFGN